MCVCARSSAVPGRRLPWFSVISCPRRPALLRRLLHVPPAQHRPHCPRRRSRHPARRRARLPHRLRHPLAPRLLLLRPPSFLPASALLLVSSAAGPCPRPEPLRLPRAVPSKSFPGGSRLSRLAEPRSALQNPSGKRAKRMTRPSASYSTLGCIRSSAR